MESLHPSKSLMIITCFVTVCSFLSVSFAQQKKICPKGSYSSTGYEPCLLCPRGYYSYKYGMKSCKKCMPGYTTVLYGADGLDPCVPCAHRDVDTPDCKLCVPGTKIGTGILPCEDCKSSEYQIKRNQTECFKCPAPMVTGGSRASSCQSCPYGSRKGEGDYCIKDSSSCTDNEYGEEPLVTPSCLVCKPGSFSTRGDGYGPCDPCQRGTYQPEFGKSSCISCDESLTSHSGSRTYHDCYSPHIQQVFSPTPSPSTSTVPSQSASPSPTKKPVRCSPGHYSVNGKCEDCPKGAYQRYYGASSCNSCRPGTYQPYSGRTSCYSCRANTYQRYSGRSYCFNCPSGYSSGTGALRCSRITPTEDPDCPRMRQ